MQNGSSLAVLKDTLSPLCGPQRLFIKTARAADAEPLSCCCSVIAIKDPCRVRTGSAAVSQKQSFPLFSFRWSRKHGDNSGVCSGCRVSCVGSRVPPPGCRVAYPPSEPQDVASHPLSALLTVGCPHPGLCLQHWVLRCVNRARASRHFSSNLVERLQRKENYLAKKYPKISTMGRSLAASTNQVSSE